MRRYRSTPLRRRSHAAAKRGPRGNLSDTATFRFESVNYRLVHIIHFFWSYAPGENLIFATGRDRSADRDILLDQSFSCRLGQQVCRKLHRRELQVTIVIAFAVLSPPGFAF
jgi:hypothetical protein